jgi:hypothetical protein
MVEKLKKSVNLGRGMVDSKASCKGRKSYLILEVRYSAPPIANNE